MSDLTIDALTGVPRDRLPLPDSETGPDVDLHDRHPLFNDATRLLIKFVSLFPDHILNRGSFREVLQAATVQIVFSFSLSFSTELVRKIDQAMFTIFINAEFNFAIGSL